MTSTVSSAPSPINAAEQSRNSAAPASASGTASPLPSAVQAQPAATSYANATKRQGPPVVASSSPAVAVGGVQQHGKSSSVSPVNGGKPSIPPAVPSVAPAIVNSSGVANSSNAQADHSRKSSVTISSSQGYMPNGGAQGHHNRASITFGSMNPGGSPAIANSVPHDPQNASLPTPPTNPRVTSPSHSPSPIPTPAPSGGRPPSSLQGQAIPLSFGSTAGEGNDQNMRAVSMPQGPSALGPQPQHLRRESSQSSHSDMGTTGMNTLNRPYNPGGGRGRGYQQNYSGPPMPSPGPQFRQPYGPQQRGGPQGMQPFQPQSPMRHVSAPFQANRSPAMNQAQLHQPHMPNGVPMFPGYPQHLQPQQQNMYGMQPQFDPQYAAYYGQPFIHPGMQYPGAPPSPRPQQFNSPHGPQQPYMQGPYGPTGPGHSSSLSMSRTPSQGPDRTPSTSNGPPSMPVATGPQSTQGSNSPAPSTSSNFTIPAKTKSKAIVIKNAAGEVIDFNATKPAPSPAAAPASPAHPPAVVSSTPTPPPKPATPQQPEKDAAPAMSAEEKRKKFLEEFQKQISGQAPTKDDPVQESNVETAKADAPPADSKPEPVAAAPKIDAVPADEDDEMERMIAEMEAEEKRREEEEKAFQEKRNKEKEEKARKEAEAKANEDDELKRLEREAEERELAREKAREAGTTETEGDAADKADFASLKRPTLGPGAVASEEEAVTPATESEPAAQPDQVAALKSTPGGKPKPAALKLETTKPVEPAQPTAGMQALKSARFLAITEEIKYPEGIQSPNPSLNISSRGKGRQYDKAFLLQFQDVFKEKPSVDWDAKVKETVGDGSNDSARPQSARTPSGVGRQASRGGPGGMAPGPMGMFGSGGPGGRTLPPGTTSMDRFKMSTMGAGPMPQGLGNFARPGPGGFGQAPAMARNPSTSSFQPARGLDSPRVGSSRGRGSKKANPREEAAAAAKMPLTAGQELKPLEQSGAGWKASSLGANMGSAPLPGGRMTPDLVQRKVKASLNKMTPEKFDKIAGDILTIAAQSKDESDGRTLRQVIQLTFEKACDEAHWASMYAKFCKRMLETMSTDIKDENVKDKHGQPVVGGALFRKYLLNRCQEEFERGWEVDLPEKPEGQTEEAAMLSDEYYIAAAAKRRGLGLIQFIGELFKLQMLTTRIMHECVLKLLNFEGVPDEAAIESLTKLLRTIGATMDSLEQGRPTMEMYFERINKIIDFPQLPSRLKYMLMDVRDLRRDGWRSKDDAKGPKTIQEIHQEAAMAQQQAELDRARHNQRGGGGRMAMGRGDARSFSGGGPMAPPDFNRNQVNMDDLKKLTRGTAARGPASSSNLGPASLLSGSRSNSGRRGLGPGSARAGEDSGVSSRTGTPPAKEKESSTNANAFSALAGLDGSGEGADDAASQPATSPPVSKSVPADLDARARSKSPAAPAADGAATDKAADGGAAAP